MRKPMSEYDWKVLKWFTGLDLVTIKILTKKHHGDYPISLLDDKTVTTMYEKENKN